MPTPDRTASLRRLTLRSRALATEHRRLDRTQRRLLATLTAGLSLLGYRLETFHPRERPIRQADATPRGRP